MTTETETTEVVEQTNDEAMDSMMAGYNRQRGIVEEEPAAAVADAPAAEEPVAAAEPETPPPPQPPSFEEQLAQYRDASTADIAKVHGKIGELNRTIQNLLQKPQSVTPEVSADLADALKNAEKVAEEFPDIAGPLVASIKALSSRAMPVAAPAAAPVNIDEVVRQQVLAERRAEAEELLAEDHADWASYKLNANAPADFKEWYAALPADRQQRYRSTESPAVVSKYLTEYKSWAAERAAAANKKQTRLAAAVTPQGEGSAGGPSLLPDSAGLTVGYKRVRGMRTAA